jgi:hypothetical protein
MDSVENLAKRLEKHPNNVSFDELCRICEQYFGEARSKGSHNIYKIPWQGDPRINIQNDKGKAKAYQVRQVIKALRRLEAEGGK